MVSVTPQQGFDAIVIGSGIGGITVAAILAKLQGKRVLVLEQHFTPGGFTHSFERLQKFHWDVGLHYVGDMGEGSTGRAVFDYITNGQLKWQKMPDPFEKFVYPDFTFAVSADPLRYQADLIKLFPDEQVAIRQYFRDVKQAVLWFGIQTMLELFPSWLHSLLKPIIHRFGAIARETTQSYLDRNFQDIRLQALLTSQWGDYGLPPSESCFGVHSLIVSHYLHGGWYPVGGGQAIAKSIMPVIAQTGGTILTQRRVTEILLHENTAIGVKVEKPNSIQEDYYAPIVISDAGAFNTYLHLIPPSYPLPYRDSIRTFPKGNSMLTVYLGLKESPEKLGFRGENHWIYTSYNHNAVPLASPLTFTPPFCYLSFPSLKDPLASAHTAEIIAPVNYDFFRQWREQPWRRRGTDYTQLKRQITESLIQLVEKHYPGFQDLIEYAELSTPLSIEYFDASDRGAVYGIPCVPERFDQPWIGAKTPIKNLYLTGTDAFSLGIMGAMMGGVKTAGLIQGPFGFAKIMSTIMQNATRTSNQNPELQVSRE